MTSTAKIRESAKHRLVVEGPDDKWTTINLMKMHGWDWDSSQKFYPYVHPAEGIEAILKSLTTEVQARPRTGFVLDADLSLSDRWAAIRAPLSKLGFSPLASPAADGTILEHQGRRVGVWLMPDNQRAGKLEDFLARLIPQGDACWPWAQETVDIAKIKHAAPFAEKDRSKAEIHTWLAWRENPGQPFGTAITATSFNHDAALAAAFVAWMNRLFRDE
jgi:hypothetical protein